MCVEINEILECNKNVPQDGECLVRNTRPWEPLGAPCASALDGI